MAKAAHDTIVRAALIIIGDEILSGRTEDKNTGYLARWLNEAGIELAEVRIVPDVKAAIVDAVNMLRAQYTYVFTTGGIGPTHDDITADCIAAAFGEKLILHPEAFARLEVFYGTENFTPARQRMARTPESAILIDNPVSTAPGFQMDNVFVMAGVPKVMQAMLEAIRPRLKGGLKVWSLSMTLYAPESKAAALMEAAQMNAEGVTIGSYPFFEDRVPGTRIVGRSRNQNALKAAMQALEATCEDAGFRHDPVAALV